MKLIKVKLAKNLLGQTDEKTISMIVGTRCQIAYRRGVFKLRDLNKIKEDGGEFILPHYRTNPVFKTLKEAVNEASRRGLL